VNALNTILDAQPVRFLTSLRSERHKDRGSISARAIPFSLLQSVKTGPELQPASNATATQVKRQAHHLPYLVQALRISGVIPLLPHIPP
jgi:hypothetical protein